LIKEYKNQIAPCKFNPSEIIKLASKQLPEKPEIIEALKNCQLIVGFCDCGDPYFVNPETEEYNFNSNVILEKENGTVIVLDVMKDGRIGSIEVGEWDKKK
jgi:hypothetical protein